MSNQEGRKPLLSDEEISTSLMDGASYESDHFAYQYGMAKARQYYEDLITKGDLIIKGQKPCGPCEEKRKRLQATRRIPPINNKQTNE